MAPGSQTEETAWSQCRIMSRKDEVALRGYSKTQAVLSYTKQRREQSNPRFQHQASSSPDFLPGPGD